MRLQVAASLTYGCRWKGYSEAHNTWEPAANILDPELSLAFETKQVE